MRISLVFLAAWVGWCFFAVLKLAPAFASQQANNHIKLLALILSLLPLILGAVGLIIWLKE